MSRHVTFAAAASLVAGVLVATAPIAARPTKPQDAPSGERRLVLLYTAEVHGAVEPCGCTSDPLGDVSRLAAMLADERRGGAAVALLDAGGLLYPEGAISAKERASADLRADMLAAQYERMGLLGAALGETDAAGGAAHVRPKRLASNFTGAPAFVRAPSVQTVGDVAVGTLGIGDPAAAAALGVKTEDMTEAARRDVAALRRAGADVVVLLAAVEKAAARRLANDAGADVVVVGKRVGQGAPRTERVGRAYLVTPAEEMQRVGRLEIVLRGARTPGVAPALTDGGSSETDRLRREEIDRALERLRVGLSKWNAPATGGRKNGSPSGNDDSFVAAKKREQAELESEKLHLNAEWKAPTTGSYVSGGLVPLRRSLRRDPTVVAAMKKLDQQIAAVNLKAATPPPPAEPGRASYVGQSRCVKCHTSAAAFWTKTVHAHAWKTLVDGGKQADYKCVGCHVTGFGQVGGSTLGFTKKLESVQCETCHGPGSLHVAGEGNEEPLAIRRDAAETVCLGCHTEQHSDTFQFEAYLRDIVGIGHGRARREKLGPGVTGHELRTAALARAKLAGAMPATPALKTKM